MIRLVVCCRQCGLEYSEEWKEGPTDVKLVRKGYCDNCCDLNNILDLHAFRNKKNAPVT